MAVRAADPDLEAILAEVRRIEVRTRRLVTGVMAGGYLSVFRGAGLEFDSVREYEPGDDPRSVDWNVTARVGRPYVKTFVDERELTLQFVVDLSASMDGGFGGRSARQVAARVCASLGFSAVRHGDKIGFVGFSDGLDARVAPRKGKGHALRIVRDCLALPSGTGSAGMAQALRFTARGLRRHAIVFVISDFLSDGWQQALRSCARRHDVVAVRLLLPELQMPGRGLLRVRDPETGRRTLIDAGQRRVREAYAERVAAWRGETERTLRRAHVDRIDVPVLRAEGADAVAGALVRFFRMRELRGRKR